MGTFIMVATLGTLCYWVVMHQIESSNLRSQRKLAWSSKTLSREQAKYNGRPVYTTCRVSRVLGKAAPPPKGCDV
ncbi:hypothetical protein KY289_035643 [Solanum tuberosum]|nr:hypothetical protein KY289_035643 [Solanum tuberosum]